MSSLSNWSVLWGGTEVSEQALEEVRQAALFYETRNSGLGRLFVEQLRRETDHLKRHPMASREIGGGFRRRLVRRFPFGILFKMDGDEIFIATVMHLKRRPGYWRDETG